MKKNYPQKEEIKNTQRATPSKEDLQKQFNAWTKNSSIKGKIQSFFTGNATAENSDWKIYNKLINGHETLLIDYPSKDLKCPSLIEKIYEQIKKEHLKNFKKSIRTLWFRGYGNGNFILIIQANLRGKNTAHECKVFIDFLKRNCPQITSCIQIQCEPFVAFNPSVYQKTHVQSRLNYGSFFMPIGNTEYLMHVLDWAPRIKDVWYNLPQKIETTIHPNPKDKFFQFYSGSGYVGLSLASKFEQVECLDCRESASESLKENIKRRNLKNVHFHRKFFSPDFLKKFFSFKENEGRWTFYLDLPIDEHISQNVIETLAHSYPERILIQIGDLEKAFKITKQMRNFGYLLRKTTPLCLEPSTGRFDVLFLFVPDRAGLLGQKKGKLAKKTEKTPSKGLFAKEIPSFSQRKD